MNVAEQQGSETRKSFQRNSKFLLQLQCNRNGYRSLLKSDAHTFLSYFADVINFVNLPKTV